MVGVVGVVGVSLCNHILQPSLNCPECHGTVDSSTSRVDDSGGHRCLTKTVRFCEQVLLFRQPHWGNHRLIRNRCYAELTTQTELVGRIRQKTG